MAVRLFRRSGGSVAGIRLGGERGPWWLAGLLGGGSCWGWGVGVGGRAVGLGRVTWHQFRHVHSSLLNDLRIPAKIAQEQLGHASISTTLGIYNHVIDASHRSAVEAVE